MILHEDESLCGSASGQALNPCHITMRNIVRIFCSVVALISVAAWVFRPEQAKAQSAFHLQEAAIAEIKSAFASGSLTCAKLTRLYLDRIDAYNLRGPALRAVITVNPKAVETAAEMDRQYKTNPSGAGPLHCIPTVIKDNFDTFDMPTTGGNVGMKQSQPLTDAFTVAKIRKAGALILGKTNLSEFARGGMSLSGLGGQTLNPYDLTRTPGGSSGGTGAALAANLAVLGTGSDTGQSIRSPASANSLVGIRPTRGLVSRSGVIPNSETQDEVGPIARSVTDAALLLDVMAGYDAADPITAFGRNRIPKSYTHLLRKDALMGARIGVMTNLSGNEARHRDVNRVMDDVAAKMHSLGATIVRFELPEYDRLAPDVATSSFEARAVMERYFATLGSTAPVKTIAQLLAAKTSAVQETLEAEFGIVDGMRGQAYKDRMLNRDKLRLAVATKMADLNLDAILYPLQKIVVVPITAADQAERNGTLSNGTGFPAVTFPAGFSTPTASAPLGVPIGGELLGLDYTEDKLLAFAYAFEQAVAVRKPPASTPPLAHEP
jgi:amidase